VVAIVIRLLENEDLPERIVPTQEMFPNCKKYEKCCTKDKEFWNKYEEQIKHLLHRKQPFRIKDVKLNITKPPEGFENYNEDIGT